MALSVTEADTRVRQNASALNLGTEHVPITAATGRILAEALQADRPFPPFNRVMMDGIAVQADAFAAGQRNFAIEGYQAAGTEQMTLKNENACIEVATGAVLPAGCDSVVMIEQVEINEGVATLSCETIQRAQHVHPEGHDRKAGDLLVAKQTLISPAEIGVAATVGKAELLVQKKPRIIVVSTGDELVSVSDTPAAHQIRQSNAHVLASMLGPDVCTFHLNDSREQIEEFFLRAFDHYDLIVLCGAVSKGKRDFIPEVLSALGAENIFHGVAQRPGKPLWFGQRQNTTIFGLPGNPVSTFVCALRYVQLWLSIASGKPAAEAEFANLSEGVNFKPALTYFLPVKLDATENASPIKGHGSGDLANLADADAFLALPPEQEHFKAGESFPLFKYRRSS